MTVDVRQCGCPNCNVKVSRRFDGVWYCNKHYLRMRSNGSCELKRRPVRSTLVDYGYEYVIVKTSKGQEILIDREDSEKIMRYSWCISKTGYPVANINGSVTKMHRYLLDLPTGNGIVDHINGNPFDNRRKNLRTCSASENAKNHGLNKNNTSGYAGIAKVGSGKYRARIVVDRKEICLGYFTTIQEAVAARNDAEKRYYGEFSPMGRNTFNYAAT